MVCRLVCVCLFGVQAAWCASRRTFFVRGYLRVGTASTVGAIATFSGRANNEYTVRLFFRGTLPKGTLVAVLLQVSVKVLQTL